jgi:hypothetical protein
MTPTWGDAVRVTGDATGPERLGEVGSVCGLREDGCEVLVLVEFADGQSIEFNATELAVVTDQSG